MISRSRSYVAFVPGVIASMVLLMALTAAHGNDSKRVAPGGFAAPGRIEGVTPTVQTGFSIVGTVKDVLTSPGSQVTRGTALATLYCDDRKAIEASADADIAEARSQLAKVKQGSRSEERRVAGASLQAYEAEAQANRNLFGRMDALKGKGGTITELQHEAAADALRTAQARVSIAQAQLELVSAPARREDIAAAEARHGAASARLLLARAEAEKCVLRAPSDALVLRVNVERGDVVSVTPPKIALTLSDTSRLRVRAEVDERFVERVKIGQPVSISSDFNPDLKLSGKVIAREGQMGRRMTLGTDPADKNDRDVLEVIVEIDSASAGKAASLPVGYRVIVAFR